MGDIVDVSEWARSRLGQEPVRNGHVARYTLGWKEERDKYWGDKVGETLGAVVEEKAKDFGVTREKILMGKMAAIANMIQLTQNPKISAKDLKIVLEALKTELGETTKITSADLTSGGQPLLQPTPLTDEQRNNLLESLKRRAQEANGITPSTDDTTGTTGQGPEEGGAGQPG